MKPAARIINEHGFLIAGLAIAVLLYYRFLFYEHLSWDDPEMVFRNKDVQHFNLHAFFTSHYVGNYIPLTMLVHAFSWLLFDNSDGGHHAVNILIHLANGILVYRFARHLTGNNFLASLSSLIFLLHPLQLESVGWIGELKTPLSAFFFLAALNAYLTFMDQRNKTQYAAVFIFFVLSCLSKPSAVVLPLALLMIDIFRAQTFKWKWLVNKIPLLVLSVLFGLVNLKTQSADQFINYAHAFPYHERLGYAGFAILKYLQFFALPFRLSVLYPYPEKTMAMAMGYSLVIALCIGGWLLIKKKHWKPFAIAGLCLVNLVLVLQFIPFGEVLYADRYMYLPLAFFALLAGLAVSKFTFGKTLLLFAALTILPFISFMRVSVWENGLTLYSDIVKKFPGSFVALNSLGVELMFRNQDEKALAALNKAAEVAPRNYKSYYNRGLLYLKMNRPEEAIKSFNEALKLYDYSKAYAGRAAAYYLTNELDKALQDAEQVLNREKGNLKARFIRANVYNERNKLDEAIADYNECIRADAENADFYFKRGIAFGKKQDFRSCLNDLDRCIEVNPLYFEAYYWRGIAKANLKTNPCPDFAIASRNRIPGAQQVLEKYCR